MKIVILDGHTTNPGDLSWAFLNEYGDVSIYDRTPKELIIERSLPADILITNKTPLPKSILEQLPNLNIALLSTGYNIADTDYLKERAYPFQTSRLLHGGGGSACLCLYSEHYNSVALHSEAVRGEWSICPDFAS